MKQQNTYKIIGLQKPEIGPGIQLGGKMSNLHKALGLIFSTGKTKQILKAKRQQAVLVPSVLCNVNTYVNSTMNTIIWLGLCKVRQSYTKPESPYVKQTGKKH